MVFCLWLFSLSVVFEVHPCCSLYLYLIPFYCWIGLPLYGCAIFCLIHLPTDKYLDCFHFLVIMNNTTLNIPMQVFINNNTTMNICLQVFINNTIWTLAYKSFCGHMFISLQLILKQRKWRTQYLVKRKRAFVLRLRICLHSLFNCWRKMLHFKEKKPF